MLRKTIAGLLLLVAACGGGSGGPSTFGTLAPTTPPTQTLVIETTLPPPPPDVADLLIPIEKMPDGWVLVDDMSGPLGLDALDSGLLEGLGDLGVVRAHRATFARSATSELGALSRGGAELIVSIAVELEDLDIAAGSVATLEGGLEAFTVSSRDIRTPGPGVRIELAGGIFLTAWSTDVILQVVIANGVPGSNINNVIPLVPEVER